MNSTEIQKTTFPKSNLESKLEKNTSLLKLKKKREKSKIKISQFKSNKKIKKNLMQKKIKISILDDNISLDTNSTLISLDEEINTNNIEMLNYLNEIENVLIDIYSKKIYLKNLKKFIELENGKEQFFDKNESVKFSEEILKNYINSLNFSEKINLILDIDETLVFSKMIKELPKDADANNEIQKLPKNEKEDIYYIIIKSYNTTLIFEVNIRKNMANFFKKLSPYCNFYINTMASPLYTKEIINLLYKFYGLRLSNASENNVFYTSPYHKKCIPDEIRKNEKFLILDDNICAWEISYIPSIIPVKKFINNNNESKNIFYQYYLFSNKIYCYDEKKRPFFNNNSKIPFCVENMEKEKSQLDYIGEIILKSILLMKILEIPLRHALHLIQNKILKNCFIYYDGYDKNFISEMVNLLGGEIALDQKDATHIILNKNILNPIQINFENKYIIDIKWVFDCFFNFNKCNEYEKDYKLI